jgi:glycosyltransferase involved in cell wall biosynthesis
MLTVLLATRNGAATLPLVFDAYCGLEPPAGGWKLVVVDNGSTDSSREVIARFEKRLPLTYVLEPKPGKNAALNTGLDHVAGDLVVFTDDDALPKPDWLVRLRAVADAQPAFAVFGGAVVPRWPTAPPAWILECVPLGWAYTVSDARLREGAVDADLVFGPNMAVRAGIFRAGRCFDPAIGPDGTRRYAMGSETEFLLRIAREGARAWHVPGAVVEHLVRPPQMRLSWLLGRALRVGRCQRRLQRVTPPLPTGGFSMLGRLGRKAAGVLVAALRLNRRRLFQAAWALAYTCGYVLEARGVRR